jgi:FAD/FMN-containing dehydrogenase
MPRPRELQLSGWGNVLRQSAQVFRPEKRSELQDVLNQVNGSSIIARGLGRSYGDAALNEHGSVLLDTRLHRFNSFDPSTGILECEAGTTISEIIDTFLPRGFFPAVTPGTRFVTVGGAIAADVHGKNHHRDGSIAKFVEGFDLLLASGETIACSPKQNAEAFWVTIGGMGLTGVIVQAKLRLARVESGYVAVDFKKTANLDEILSAFAAGDANYQYSVAWIDCLAKGAALGRSVLMRGNHARPSDLPVEYHDHALRPPSARRRSVPFHFPSFALSPVTVRLFNSRYYRRHEDGRQILHYDEFFYPLDAVEHWNRVYGRRGFYQYQALFPQSDRQAGLRELIERVSNSGRASFLAVLKSMGERSGGLLSFPLPGLTLALDLANAGRRTVDLLGDLDQIVLRHGGRVYLAKDATLSRENFEAMYPDLPQFKQIKQQLDPSNRFSSSLSRRLGIGAGL